ncbi:YebC/PmpR family DNA-binding transcriptional regulator [Candidatus Gillettellia adelgis]
MAGHSKWANTKHRKAVQDTKRSKIFEKIIRNLVITTSSYGENPNFNPRLRVAIDKALANNMTRETINRAIARGMGGDAYSNLTGITYEGYGPGGAAVMIECVSDNRNRTASIVRHVFAKCGGHLGTDGSAAYLFTQKGVITYASSVDEDALIKAAMEANVEDIISHAHGTIDVFTTRDSLYRMKDLLTIAGFNAVSVKIALVPLITADIDIKNAPKLLRLVRILEDCDDVQRVYHNGVISDMMLAML